MTEERQDCMYTIQTKENMLKNFPVESDLSGLKPQRIHDILEIFFCWRDVSKVKDK